MLLFVVPADVEQPRGRVISVDIQHMLPLGGACVLALSDFTQETIQKRILDLLNIGEPLSTENLKFGNIGYLPDYNTIQFNDRRGLEFRSDLTPTPAANMIVSKNPIPIVNQRRADVLLSDMAPSATGVKSLDHQQIIALATSVLRFSLLGLTQGGTCVVKLWRGCETDKLTEAMRKCFTKVREVKPLASRADSAEIFVLGTEFYL